MDTPSNSLTKCWCCGEERYVSGMLYSDVVKEAVCGGCYGDLIIVQTFLDALNKNYVLEDDDEYGN